MARGRGAVAAHPLLQLRGEALDPAVHGRVINLHAAISEHPFEVAVADRQLQVPAHGPKDHLGREAKATECAGSVGHEQYSRRNAGGSTVPTRAPPPRSMQQIRPDRLTRSDAAMVAGTPCMNEVSYPRSRPRTRPPLPRDPVQTSPPRNPIRAIINSYFSDLINRRQRSSHPPWTKVREFCRVCQRSRAKSLHLAFDAGRMTSEAGILLLAAVEQRIGIAGSVLI